MDTIPPKQQPEEFVEDLCARDPLAARTRHVLLRLEKQGHKLGWDHPDNIGQVFCLEYHPRTQQVAYRWSDGYTECIKFISSRNGHNIGMAFQLLARVTEQMANGELRDYIPPELRHITERAGPGGDMWSAEREGWSFYGYGFRCEAWMVAHDDTPETERLRSDHRLDEHPRRIETRQICFTARDGLLWWITRRRGQQPTVQVERPEADQGVRGNVINGLSRLTNVIAGNPVPIRERGVSDL